MHLYDLSDGCESEWEEYAVAWVYDVYKSISGLDYPHRKDTRVPCRYCMVCCSLFSCLLDEVGSSALGAWVESSNCRQVMILKIHDWHLL